MSEELYVLVAERDGRADDPESRMICFEQYLDQGAATLENVRALQGRLGNKYGKTRIARLEFIEDWKGESNGK